MTWYFAKDGIQQGPVSEEQIRSMIRDGSLRRGDLVWREGMAAWLPASEAGIELSFPSGPPSALPPPPPPQYMAPPPAPYAPYSSSLVPATGAAAIQDYLAWSIAATLLCCLPLGIIAIVFSVKANNAKAAGDLRTAAEAANQAKIWLYVSVGLGLLAGLFYGVVFIASLAQS